MDSMKGQGFHQQPDWNSRVSIACWHFTCTWWTIGTNIFTNYVTQLAFKLYILTKLLWTVSFSSGKCCSVDVNQKAMLSDLFNTAKHFCSWLVFFSNVNISWYNHAVKLCIFGNVKFIKQWFCNHSISEYFLINFFPKNLQVFFRFPLYVWRMFVRDGTNFLNRSIWPFSTSSFLTL